MEKESKSTNEYIIKCGEMKIDQGKVKPNPNKGNIVISVNSDKLLCWQWISLDKKTVSEPIVIFSDEWEWIKVPTGKGRVFQLKNKCFEDIFVYWLFDYDDVKEKIMINDVSIILKNGSLLPENENNNINKNNKVINDSTTNTINTTNTSNNKSMMDIIDQALNNTRKKQPGLRRILSNKNIKDLLCSEDFIKDAIKHLPEGQQSQNYYTKNISSPQFIQAIQSFSEALNSENYDIILSSFGLNYSDAKDAKDGVEGLIKCILKKYPKK